MKKQFFSFFVIALVFCGCTHIPLYGPPDLDSYRQAARKTVEHSLLIHPSIVDFPKDNGGYKPAIGIGRIRNKTGDSGEHQKIDIEQVTNRIRESLFNSGQVEIIDEGGFGRVADYYLEGEIKASWVNRVVDGRSVRERQFSFSLWMSNIKTSSIVWMNTVDVPGVLLNPDSRSCLGLM